ncbi:MAG TPA: hypothetical protein PLZ51_07990, partial [Aggregatilineales bacterium]|nr:hypothetical protein [Aggregatilineales bacterium]
IRRVATALGHPVKKLVRTHIGQLDLGKLKRGEWAELNALQIQAMKTPAPELEYIKKRRKILRETEGPRKSFGDKTESRPRGTTSRPKSEGYVSRERRDSDGDSRPPRRPSGEGSSRPPRREGDGDSRPPRR